MDNRRHPNDPRTLLLAGLPVKERRLDLAGISTALLEGGEGPPIVLLHGPGEYAAKWLRVIPMLVKDHRVIAPDLPGHGTSEVTGSLDLARMIDWLGALIDATCSAPSVLVGEVMGGALGLRFAAKRSDRLRHLVLSDTLGLVPFQPSPEFGHALTSFLQRPDEETHEALWKRCVFDLDRLREQLGGRWESIEAYNIDRARAPATATHLHRMMEMLGFPPVPAEELETITVPTTLIWGRHDLATPLAAAQAASARYGWPLHVIEEAADNAPIEQPDAFVRALREAIADR